MALALEPGKLVAHYRLIEKAGEGGMGVIFKALDTKLNRHVALKLLPEDLTSAPERRLRFEREAQATAALQHPNIAVIYEIGEHEGAPFIAMEYIEGASLRTRLESTPLTLREWLKVATQIADAMAHAHSQGIIHRDLKPDNVMVSSDNKVKVLDFGLAKLLDPSRLPEGSDRDVHTRMDTISGELTRAGSVFGTASYMSPEQARGETVDHRSDIFSLAVVLYECISGRRPFRGASPVETLNNVINAEPPTLVDDSGEIPFEVERIIRKAMEKEPDRRYQHAEELVTDLRNLKRDVASGRTQTVTSPSGVVTQGRTARSPLRARWFAAVPLVVVVGALLALLALRGGRDATPETGVGHADEGAVAVIGFENLGDPEDSEHLGRMLMALVTTDLAETGSLSIVSMPRVLAALRDVRGGEHGRFDAALAAEAAEKAGARIMLVGQVGKVGERLMLTSELIDVESGQTLGSNKQTAESTQELFEVAGAIASRVREQLGHTLEVEASPDDYNLAEALTSSPEAYRHYAVGELALHQLEWPEAAEHFARAIRQDQTFAMANYRQAIALNWMGEDAAAVRALEDGLPYVGRLPQRWRIMYEVYLDYCHDGSDAVYEKLTRFLETSPDIPDPYYVLAEILTHVSRYRDPARAKDLFARALQIDPSFKIVVWHLIDGYIAAGELQPARALAEQLRQDNPNDPTLVEAEAAILAAEGDLEQAIVRCEQSLSRGFEQVSMRLVSYLRRNGNLERALELARSDLAGESSGGELGIRTAIVAAIDVQRGKIRDGLAGLETAAKLTEPTSLKALGSGYRRARARLYADLGDHTSALEAARAAVAIDTNHNALYELGVQLLAAGQPAEAERSLAQMQELSASWPTPLGVFWEHLLRSELHLAAGRIDDARTHLERASALPTANRALLEEWGLRARLRAAAGDARGAAEAYRRAIDAERRASFGDAIEMKRMLYPLARVEEEAGDIESARNHYREYLEHWADADMPFLAVPKAQERLARLQTAP